MSITQLLGRFVPRHPSDDVLIRPTATVAGPVPQRVDLPDRVIYRPHLVARSKKRLMDAA